MYSNITNFVRLWTSHLFNQNTKIPTLIFKITFKTKVIKLSLMLNSERFNQYMYNRLSVNNKIRNLISNNSRSLKSKSIANDQVYAPWWLTWSNKSNVPRKFPHQAFVFAMNSQLLSISFCRANNAADFTWKKMLI